MLVFILNKFILWSILWLKYLFAIGEWKFSIRTIGTDGQSFCAWRCPTKEGFTRKKETVLLCRAIVIEKRDEFFFSYSLREKLICKYHITISIDPW